jgi:hypothetical protein
VKYLAGLVSNWDPPSLASQVSRIIHVNHWHWKIFFMDLNSSGKIDRPLWLIEHYQETKG